jgi:integrase
MPSGSQIGSHIRLTDVALKNLKPPAKRTVLWAQGMPGLGVRLHPSGSRTFIYSYWIDGVKRWLNIGAYPEVPLREALKKYADASDLVAKGVDPAKPATSRATGTVNDLIDRYEKHSIARGKKSIKEEFRMLRKELHSLRNKKVAQVKKTDLNEIVENIMERGSKQTASHLYAYMHRMFALAVMWDLRQDNPVSNIERPAKGQARDRSLSFTEIWKVWHGLEQSPVKPVVRYALLFVLVTMQRGQDVRGLKWSDIDFKEKIWKVPQPKNKRPWQIPLNDLAIEILEKVKPYTGETEGPFAMTRARAPSEGLKFKPMKQKTLSDNIDYYYESWGVAKFTPHDLRRTAATGITTLGCPRFWATLLLNHADKHITAVYDQYEYDREKRTAANIWNLALMRIVNAKTIASVPTIDPVREEVKSLLNR